MVNSLGSAAAGTYPGDYAVRPYLNMYYITDRLL